MASSFNKSMKRTYSVLDQKDTHSAIFVKHILCTCLNLQIDCRIPGIIYNYHLHHVKNHLSLICIHDLRYDSASATFRLILGQRLNFCISFFTTPNSVWYTKIKNESIYVNTKYNKKLEQTFNYIT